MINSLKILFISSFLLNLAYGQISPGELTSAHKELEGISNCTKCHVLGEKIENDKCLDCHKEIKELVNLNLGYHASNDVKNKGCIKCHGEHFGRDFAIINFEKDKFDHTLTTFSLIGKHKEIDCEKCHQKRFIKSDDIRKRTKTFLGLENRCQNCHENFHQGKFKDQKCDNCHNSDAWKPAPGFDHKQTNFILVGAHLKVKCEKCHKNNGEKLQNFKISKFNKCINCHSDIHDGKLGAECQSCHTNQSFKISQSKNKFDHTKTGFVLSGAHRNIQCRKCHVKGISVKIKHDFCKDCHSDYHKGEFKDNGVVKDCANCHNDVGFTPSTFTINDHDKTEFKLAGGHLAVPCSNCHLTNLHWGFSFSGTNCEICHKNVHRDKIINFKNESGLCEVCHNVNTWQQINFDHKITGYELIGKHISVECSKCHFNLNSSEKLFTKLSNECKNCHNDEHNGQFEVKYENKCSTCHSSRNWNEINFDHNSTRFKLDGSHSKIACHKCHLNQLVNGEKIVKYKFEDISCRTCHT